MQNQRGAKSRRRELSQNFLTDRTAIASVLQAARPRPDDLIVEVGAGRGALTRELARSCRKVVAFEIDERLAGSLPDIPRVQVVHGDFLRAEPPEEEFAVVGNIPFAVTARIVDWCLGADRLTSATMVTQLEYARKRTGDYGRWTRLTVETWPLFEWRLHGRIPRRSFRPMPAVDCGILRLTRRAQALLPQGSLPDFRDLVSLGFTGVGGSLHASLRRHHSAPRLRDAFDAAELDRRTVVGFAPPGRWITLFRRLHRID
ncbi:ErmE/ErmH/ErmO/ErmR family 23S rRNA (adenine(2058)-N(6))-methyltransferase [Rhizohabitans arisaemae]|uniref:ErmE/ErmH/ErmO/ErmR family 23S rRNA (adenine(2058)-N(6))-methyltransferase n=1 Tax=Rhizohabitans arisaemae TaxID=2720610 RepID=UPI0024B26C8D|nr:ErmE/ErmH/ErmO/ErmR family 23S rRNA (adenine(2058)-N(6))-methyltransferase [Rhizohabitans arisaemae]